MFTCPIIPCESLFTNIFLKSVVVFPTTAEDVSKCVLFAQANNLELAVKGGGHATSGSSSTDGGLCIDLDKMRAVTVNTDEKTVTAQGGALWKDVDDAAAVHKLACVGGTVNQYVHPAL